MAKNTTIARLNTIVDANAKPFVSELERAGRVAKKQGSFIKKALREVEGGLRINPGSLLAGFGIGSLVAFGKSAMELGGKISDLSDQAGMTPKSLQLLSAYARENGVDMETVAKASEHLRSGLQTAVEKGSAPLNASLEKLHLTAAGLQGLAPEEQWQVIANRVAVSADKQEAFNAVSDIFGEKVGPKLRKTLEDIAVAYGELEKKKPKGPILTDKEVKELDDADDFWERQWMNVKVFSAKALAEHGKETGFIWDKLSGIFSSEKKSTGLPDIPAEKTSAAGPDGIPQDDFDRRMKDAEQAAFAKKFSQDVFSDLPNKKEYESGFMSTVDFLKQHDERRKAVDNVPTDSLSRIGLMTGQLQTNIEQKKQTDLLKSSNDKLTRILDTLRNGRDISAFVD